MWPAGLSGLGGSGFTRAPGPHDVSIAPMHTRFDVYSNDIIILRLCEGNPFSMRMLGVSRFPGCFLCFWANFRSQKSGTKLPVCGFGLDSLVDNEKYFPNLPLAWNFWIRDIRFRRTLYGVRMLSVYVRMCQAEIYGIVEPYKCSLPAPLWLPGLRT